MACLRRMLDYVLFFHSQLSIARCTISSAIKYHMIYDIHGIIPYPLSTVLTATAHCSLPLLTATACSLPLTAHLCSPITSHNSHTNNKSAGFYCRSHNIMPQVTCWPFSSTEITIHCHNESTTYKKCIDNNIHRWVFLTFPPHRQADHIGSYIRP